MIALHDMRDVPPGQDSIDQFGLNFMIQARDFLESLCLAGLLDDGFRGSQVLVNFGAALLALGCLVLILPTAV